MNDKYLQTLAALCKRGLSEEVTEFFKESKRNTQQETFVMYMDEMISRSGMSRAKIVEKVGLSKEYMYKVLRGDKTTTERDYILAVCISLEMNLLETQHALSLYPFPILDESDNRSAVIMSGIMEGVNIFTLNAWLEKANLLPIKVSPEMESSKVGPVRSTTFSSSVIESNVDEPTKLTRKRIRNMEVTTTTVIAEHFGNAPFDYFYMGELELTDEENRKLYASAAFFPTGESVFGIYNYAHDADITQEQADAGVIEQFESLEDASESPFFLYYLELDRLTDKKVVETMAYVNDTKNYGFRLGCQFTQDGWMVYTEAYNAQHPEYQEYIQVRETKDGYIYSASHQSYFMQYELAGMEGYYEMLFGPVGKQLYLFESTSMDNLGEYQHFKNSFEQVHVNINYFKEQMLKESKK